MKFTSNLVILASLLFSATAFANENIPAQNDITSAEGALNVPEYSDAGFGRHAMDVAQKPDSGADDYKRALAAPEPGEGRDPEPNGGAKHEGSGEGRVRQLRYASRDIAICPPDICDDEGNYRDDYP